MGYFLPLMVGAGIVLVAAMRENRKVRRVLAKHSGKAKLLPQALTLLVLSAQVSELIKVIGQVTPVHVASALFLLALLAGTRSGTESELR